MILLGLKGNSYHISDKPINSGGEGEIYEIKGYSGLLLKTYTSKTTSLLESKLKYMINNMPLKSVLNQIAWPLDVVYTQSGVFCGFVMYKLKIDELLASIYSYPPKPNALTYKERVIIAYNLCLVIDEIHKAGYVFGDFNPQNIGVDSDTGLVAFLDTDSFHIVDKKQKIEYRCNVCKPGYVAPELLKKCKIFAQKYPQYSSHIYANLPLDSFTKETDNFALSIHIFKILMNGYSPYSGARNNGRSTSSPALGDKAVEKNEYCFRNGLKPYSSRILPLQSFPHYITRLISRAFDLGYTNPKSRPSASEWLVALDKYYNETVECKKNSLHYYFSGLKSCPYCKVDEIHNKKMNNYNSRSSFVAAPNQKRYSRNTNNTQNYSRNYSQTTRRQSSGSQTSFIDKVINLYGKGIKITLIVMAVCAVLAIAVSAFGDIASLFMGVSGSSNNENSSNLVNQEEEQSPIDSYLEQAGELEVKGESLSEFTLVPLETSNGKNSAEVVEGIKYNNISYKNGISFYVENDEYGDYDSTISVAYDVNGQYNVFYSKLICYEDNFDREAVMRIYGDDQLLFTSPVLVDNGIENTIYLDISGVKQLKFEVAGAKWDYNQATWRKILLAEPVVSTELYESISHKDIPLHTLAAVSTEKTHEGNIHYPVANTKISDINFDYGIRCLVKNDEYGDYDSVLSFAYDIDGKYNTFKSKLLCIDGYFEREAVLKIFGDDVLLYMSPNLVNNEVVHDINLNIEGVNNLTFLITGNKKKHSSNTWREILLGNAVLSTEEYEEVIKNEQPLNEMTPILAEVSAYTNRYFPIAAKQIDDNPYNHGVQFYIENYQDGKDDSTLSLKYNIEGKYNTFKSKLLCIDGYFEREAVLKIFGDDVLLYMSPNLVNNEVVHDINLNIEGVNNLTFLITGNKKKHSSNTWREILLGNAVLSTEEYEEVIKNEQPLNEMTPILAEVSAYTNRYFPIAAKRIDDNPYNHGVQFYIENYQDGKDDSTLSLKYNIEGKYNTFKSKLLCIDGYFEREAVLKIFGDDVLLYMSPNLVNNEVVHDINLNIEGVNNLTFLITGNKKKHSSNTWREILLGNAVLSTEEYEEVIKNEQPLNEMTPILAEVSAYTNRYFPIAAKRIDDNPYNHGVQFYIENYQDGKDDSTLSLKYNIEGKYNTFKSKLLCIDGYFEREAVLKIFGDDVLLYMSPNLVNNEVVHDINLNIEGVNNLTFLITGNKKKHSSNTWREILLGNAVLSTEEYEEVIKNEQPLNEMTPILAEVSAYTNRYFPIAAKRIDDNPYNHGVQFYIENYGSVAKNL